MNRVLRVWIGRLAFSSAVVICVSSQAGPALWAQEKADPAHVLEEAQGRLQSTVRRLPKYTCVQTVDRAYLEPKQTSFPAPSCQEILQARKSSSIKLQITATDRLRLDVAVSEGHEIHSWAGASRFDTRRVDEIVTGGPIGTGPFGTFLKDIFENEGASFSYDGERRDGSKLRIVYRYKVPGDSSHYMIGGEKNYSVTAFDGEFEIEPSTFDLERLTVQTAALPPGTGMCQANTTLEYQHVRIGTGEFLLPSENRLQIVYSNGYESDSRTTYSSCREYLGESSLKFEGFTSTEPDSSRPVPRVETTPLAAGLSLDLRLAAPIDTDIAAAGDRVSATVANAVKDRQTGRALVPAGAILRGRITRMEHRQRPSAHFLIVIQFDSLEHDGVVAPVAARLDRSDEFKIAGRQVWMLGGASRTGSLVFPTSKSRYVVPAGYAMRWRTIEVQSSSAN